MQTLCLPKTTGEKTCLNAGQFSLETLEESVTYRTIHLSRENSDL